MTERLEQVIERARALPDEEQDTLASIILDEMESEARWAELFSRSESADLLSRLADEALAEVRVGRVKPLDVNEL